MHCSQLWLLLELGTCEYVLENSVSEYLCWISLPNRDNIDLGQNDDDNNNNYSKQNM